MNKIYLIAIIFFGNLIQLNAQENVIWKFKTNDRVYSSPLIDNNTVFFGSGDTHFYALRKDTGKELWKFKTAGAVHSTATISSNTIYFGSVDGNLYAVNKINGNLIWKFSSEGEKSYGLWDYYLSSPKVIDGVVFWGSGDGHLYAINSVSGLLKWKYKTGDIVHASPIIKNNRVYFGSFDGLFYALDSNNGSEIWKFNTLGDTYFPKGEIQKSAVLDNGIVYFGSRDYNMYALNAKDGSKIWNIKDERGWIIATPLIYENKLFFGVSDGHAFYAVNKTTGEINWKTPIPMRVYGSAISNNNIIYFGSFDGKILGLDYKTGNVKWEFQTEKSEQNYSTIYNDNGHFKEGFELYGADYIKIEAQIHELGSILSTPVIENDIIYFTSSDGYCYAVELN